MRSPLPPDLLALMFEWHKPACVVVYTNPAFTCLVHWRYSMDRLLCHYRLKPHVLGRAEQMFCCYDRRRKLPCNLSDTRTKEEEENSDSS